MSWWRGRSRRDATSGGRAPEAHPPRLSSLSAEADPLGVGRLFRQARELPQEELPRLRWRLRTSQHLRTIRPRLFLRVAVIIGVAFFMGGVVGAVVSPYWAKRKTANVVGPAAALAPAPAPAKPKRRRSVSARKGSEAFELYAPVPDEIAPLTEPLLVDGPAPDALAIARAPLAPLTAPALPKVTSLDPRRLPKWVTPRLARAEEPTPSPAVAPAAAVEPPPTAPSPATSTPVTSPAPSAIAAEQAVLGQVIKALRRERDPAAALALLGQHEQSFSRAALASEATALRIEALLTLGRTDEALTILDRQELASSPNGDEQRVVRGELRAARGRWRDAERDFADALARWPLPAASPKARGIQERALWGRAAARSRLGAEDGARTDLELSLRHFPAGRFSAPARALLKDKP